MKLRMIGLTAILALSFSCCTKIETDVVYEPLVSSVADSEGKYIKARPSDPENNCLKVFGEVQTKSQMVPVWNDGDMVCVYSLDSDNRIIFKDTCTVYSINRDVAKITAEVAKKSEKYFASYPFDHIKGNVGEVLNLNQEGYVNHTGIFGDESVMTSFCQKNKSAFVFENRYSLFKMENVRSKNFPLTITFTGSNTKQEITYTEFSEDILYTAIWYKEIKNPSVVIKYMEGKKERTVIKKFNQSIIPAHVYLYRLEK